MLGVAQVHAPPRGGNPAEAPTPASSAEAVDPAHLSPPALQTALSAEGDTSAAPSHDDGDHALESEGVPKVEVATDAASSAIMSATAAAAAAAAAAATCPYLPHEIVEQIVLGAARDPENRHLVAAAPNPDLSRHRARRYRKHLHRSLRRITEADEREEAVETRRHALLELAHVQAGLQRVHVHAMDAAPLCTVNAAAGSGNVAVLVARKRYRMPMPYTWRATSRAAMHGHVGILDFMQANGMEPKFHDRYEDEFEIDSDSGSDNSDGDDDDDDSDEDEDEDDEGDDNDDPDFQSMDVLAPTAKCTHFCWWGLDLAARAGHMSVFAWWLKARGRKAMSDESSWRTWTLAAMHGRVDLLSFLFDEAQLPLPSVFPNPANQCHWPTVGAPSRMVDAAAAFGQVNVLEWLLAHAPPRPPKRTPALPPNEDVDDGASAQLPPPPLALVGGDVALADVAVDDAAIAQVPAAVDVDVIVADADAAVVVVPDAAAPVIETDVEAAPEEPLPVPEHVPFLYTRDAVDLASANGHVSVLQTLLESKRWIKYTKMALNKASDLPVLDWWLHSGLPMVYSAAAVDAAALAGRCDLIEWWMNAHAQHPDRVPEIRFSISAMMGASAKGNVDVLRQLVANTARLGSPLKYNATLALTQATLCNHTHVVEWWLFESGLVDMARLEATWTKPASPLMTASDHAQVDMLAAWARLRDTVRATAATRVALPADDEDGEIKGDVSAAPTTPTSPANDCTLWSYMTSAVDTASLRGNTLVLAWWAEQSRRDSVSWPFLMTSEAIACAAEAEPLRVTDDGKVVAGDRLQWFLDLYRDGIIAEIPVPARVLHAASVEGDLQALQFWHDLEGRGTITTLPNTLDLATEPAFQWWVAHRSDTTIPNYTEASMDNAAATGNIERLQFWLTCGMTPKYSARAVDLASANGHKQVVEFFNNNASANLLPEFRYTSAALDGASANGHMDLLFWWRECGHPLRFSAAAMDGSSRNGHLECLFWWLSIGQSDSITLKYSRQVLEQALDAGNMDVVEFWLGSELPFGEN